ncbi:NAD(P)H-dependent oxidoreductase [Paenibacillus sp. GCM10012307]|uniref:NAD(P)H-dependent oxidoreductase n=1 Tax=Paenibacillus roseus TaxID=2798579 RepID=A0A934MXB4_9BACL|nr:NAD(P)H-dependent oxidoreductase [Paenibacillus roseus]MBJ6364017.1 NAD(P)H-dependent oxidoreductase [Paenibacillus roseus]
MNHLIVYAHSEEGSFNNAILDTVVKALEAKGHDVHVRDLYKLGFDPIFSKADSAALRAGNPPADIKTEQEYLAQADFITFIYPIWWTGLPAIIKGYVDRTFSYGFAYQYNQEGGIDKLFAGKKGAIINTHGTPSEIYDAIGMTAALKQTSGNGIYEFCGIEVAEHLLFGGIPASTTAEERSEILNQIEKRFSSF